jgi:hypothetical protein
MALPDMPQEFQTVHIRHVDVADHQVDRIFGFGLVPDDVKRRPAVIGLQDFFRTQQLQQLDEGLTLERMILDDQQHQFISGLHGVPHRSSWAFLLYPGR